MCSIRKDTKRWLEESHSFIMKTHLGECITLLKTSILQIVLLNVDKTPESKWGK